MSRSVVGKLRPAGQIQPAKSFHPARQHRSVYATIFVCEELALAVCTLLHLIADRMLSSWYFWTMYR